MCGIVGYVGARRVVPVVLEGLRRLEYRGYDSAGIVYLQDGRLVKYRAAGKLSSLEAIIDEAIVAPSHIGLGHTRWATHGAPTTENAHPHTDCSGNLVVVHNGIIENYHSLREELLAKGHRFSSETDTEVLAHLIEEYLAGDDLIAAVRKALDRVEGSYALAVLWTGKPDTLIAVRNHSPLVLGVDDENGSFLASDIPAFLPFTKQVIFLEDLEMAVLTAAGRTFYSLQTGKEISKEIKTIEWTAAMAEKGGYRHFMLKEIFEQPQAIINTVSGRINLETGAIELPEIHLAAEDLQKIDRIFLVACGTSWHAALVAKYWIERWAQIPVEVDIASEFRYRKLLINERVLTIAISQSGETADTLAGIRLAKKLGSKIITICNVVGSTMTREADGTVYTHAGPEIGVASTKAFISQLAALFLFTLYLGEQKKTISAEKSRELGQALIGIAAVIEVELPRLQEEIRELVDSYYDCRDFLFIGRGLNFPIALEGALKLKEISYIHAEGYASGELKHGPIALIDKEMPILALVPRDGVYQKSISNVEEIKARQGRLILLGTEGDSHLQAITEDVIYLPQVHEEMNPILYTIPAQLLAYEIATRRGCDVDQPRNLAKSVTVE
ncbi:MAG: glutamine--fructose-6-phosphate transaminase (isomerizing) [Proteobacteria bacterium]|jgi:glucosamine--fructose-6-phosphate aminotransferase (isomerizing)|nr:glutamine--fructose-6-phosphate transaminase (isomerizing) [Desulfocapsa sp.]MBU3945930.1 glutamine--fructose-6-phosphate transaminase (isomerizing) [Pseudomonadota bacterium]MCG2744985.1 glutamine--fructose-6-phosphate transaminase (isomerizing) [Desulfobacteraceae bacterium]MBU4027494.1 glutamine--fructose-6-phosphate transaminase (isomerizing) [Pseudomonadota bacterium]MBU4042693.1 glutamine--fructose-6-phosphate transaminase (isomerizing) [Pseudomonadota bacterium]